MDNVSFIEHRKNDSNWQVMFVHHMKHEVIHRNQKMVPNFKTINIITILSNQQLGIHVHVLIFYESYVIIGLVLNVWLKQLVKCIRLIVIISVENKDFYNYIVYQSEKKKENNENTVDIAIIIIFIVCNTIFRRRAPCIINW